MRREVLLCLFAFVVFVFAVDNGDVPTREKRVSVQDDNAPNSEVNFDGPEKSSKKQQFKSMKSPSGNGISGGTEYNFPVVIPPYGQPSAKLSPKPEWGSCMLYLESISVLVFCSNCEGSMTSAVATVDGAKGNTYSFGDDALSCLQPDDTKVGDKNPKEFWFRIQVNIKDPVNAYKFGDKEDGGRALFSVRDPIKLLLKFQRKSDFSWRVTDVVAEQLNVKSGNWLKKDLSVASGASSDNANRSVQIGGFTDHSYACSSTPAAAWKVEEKMSVGVSFNNIQLQPFGIWKGKEGQDEGKVRFGRNVNDCVGLFSIGSWMGIVVAIVLLMVLFFGYLMLNSVQTMDRFDDPKQKQLIINAKE